MHRLCDEIIHATKFKNTSVSDDISQPNITVKCNLHKNERQ